ncbi:MAG: HAD family phosphatase [Treponemataceae bacterium]|nr:HAD family phosphatase [Treponemataceae bacterium]
MNPSNPPFACIFDMDGLLYDTETLCRRLWQEYAQEIGYTVTDELYASCIGHNETDVKEILRTNLGDGFPIQTLYAEIRKRMLKYFGTFGPPEKPGIRPLFDFLRENRIPMALATSNGESHARNMIERSKLTNYFDAWAFGEQVEHSKPLPDIFLLAARQLDMAPEKCIVFEDSVAGLMAAQAAGMRNVFIKDLIEPPAEILEKVTWRLQKLDDAVSPLKSLLS